MERRIKLGLIGKNISHSLSPSIYKELLDKDIDYQLIDIASEDLLPRLDDLFKELDGLSITSPYKKSYLTSIKNTDDFPAINTIKKVGSDFIATNTDLIATTKQLAEFDQEYREYLPIILGNGVMASLLSDSFKSLGIPYEQYSRKVNPDFYTREYNGYNHKQTIIINCCAREFEFKNKVSPSVVFWDLNYDHDFHLKNLSTTLNYIDGKNFLLTQAKAALEFWNLY